MEMSEAVATGSAPQDVYAPGFEIVAVRASVSTSLVLLDGPWHGLLSCSRMADPQRAVDVERELCDLIVERLQERIDLPAGFGGGEEVHDFVSDVLVWSGEQLTLHLRLVYTLIHLLGGADAGKARRAFRV